MARTRKLNWVTVPAGKCSNDGLTVYTVPKEYPRPGRRGGYTVIQNNPVSLGRWVTSLDERIDLTAAIHQLFTAADFADYETAQADVHERIKNLEAAGKILAVGHYTDPYSVQMTKEYDNWFFGCPFTIAKYIYDDKYRPVTSDENLPLYQVIKGQDISIGCKVQHPGLLIESIFTDYGDRNEEQDKIRKTAAKRAGEYVAAGILKKIGTVSRGGYDLLGGYALPYTITFTDKEVEKDFFNLSAEAYFRLMDKKR